MQLPQARWGSEAATMDETEREATFAAGAEHMAPAESRDDRQVQLQPSWRTYSPAVVFNASRPYKSSKTRRLGDRGEEGSVAGSDATDLSRATTVLQAAVTGSCKLVVLHGVGSTSSQQATPELAPCLPSAANLAVHRHMDTHRPVRVGGGYRPPQDRPPPVAGS